MRHVITAHPIVDTVLDRYRDQLGPQLPAYRHHVLRGLNYQRDLLGANTVPDTAALAWAVHDLGVWTANTFDYLEPSAALAAEFTGEFGITDLDTVQRLVMDHHRLRPVDDPLIETFRRADRTDASRGLIRGGVSRAMIRATVDALPYAGFHSILLRRGTSHALAHPTNPLPMLRW
ncbi:hypothetical protein GPX89_31185 [Nocardia sp. ET3-3]|uniref:Phosphohydrolase n=1 Tax=Nocardia terrae TaxID=2675851 RepID=A0A7K1V4V6_9NOCA|nr:hypothetical protein [Nocardia terrae]